MNSQDFQTAADRLEFEFRQSELPRASRQGNIGDSPKERLQIRIQREPALRAAIDAACVQWSQGKGWPRMDADVCDFVWDRLAEGQIFVGALRKKAVWIGASSSGGILCWLLVDYWSLAGCYRWHARLHAM